MRKINCLVCGNESVLLRKLKESIVYKCKSCELEFCNPMPSQEMLDRFYSSYVDVRANPRIVTKNARKNTENLGRKHGLSPNHYLLDFGCGDNLFVKSSHSLNWVGYDKYTSPEFPEGEFDFITLWGVLEHLTSPVETITDLNRKLKTKGKLVITTVGTDTKIPYQYKFPEHVTWWSNSSIERLLGECGIELKEISSYFMFQTPEVYLTCVLNAGKVPDDLKKRITFNRKRDVYVPTNEIFIVGEKK